MIAEMSGSTFTCLFAIRRMERLSGEVPFSPISLRFFHSNIPGVISVGSTNPASTIVPPRRAMSMAWFKTFPSRTQIRTASEPASVSLTTFGDDIDFLSVHNRISAQFEGLVQTGVNQIDDNYRSGPCEFSTQQCP